jgi:hypothetical protein
MRKVLALAVVLFTLSALAQEPRATAHNPQFDALKALAGDWTSKLDGGRVGTGNYRIVSGNSAIILDQQAPGEGNMITMFHPDGQKTLATHYCSMGNQPRMVADASSETNRIQFKFKDVTNDDGKSGFMRDLTIVFLDKDHHDQIWTWQDGSGKQESTTLHYVRANAPVQGK